MVRVTNKILTAWFQRVMTQPRSWMMTYMAKPSNTYQTKWIVWEASTTRSRFRCSIRIMPVMNCSKNSWRSWLFATLPRRQSHIKSTNWQVLSAKATRVYSGKKSLSLNLQTPMGSSSRPVRDKCWQFKGKETSSDTMKSWLRSSKSKTNGLQCKWFSPSKLMRRTRQSTSKQIFAWSFNSSTSTTTSSLATRLRSFARKEFTQLQSLRESVLLRRPMTSFTPYKIKTLKKVVMSCEKGTWCPWRSTWNSSGCLEWKLKWTSGMHSWLKNWGTMASVFSCLAVKLLQIIWQTWTPLRSFKITASRSMFWVLLIDKLKSKSRTA